MRHNPSSSQPTAGGSAFRPARDVRTLADWTIRRRLQSIPGVAEVLFALVFLAACGSGWARPVVVADLKALEKACAAAVPGDEIILQKGIYRLEGKSRILINQRSGPVTVRGETGKPEDVILEGLGQENQTVQVIFELTDSPSWTFQDLTTRNTYYHGFKLNGGSMNCVLRHVTMRDHGESGVKGTSTPGSPQHPDALLVENCDIGFSQASGGTRAVVEGIDGVAVAGWIIRGNRFLHIQRGGSPAYAAFTKGNSSGTVIEGNRFEDCFIGASLGGGGTGPTFFRDGVRGLEHRGGAIKNNIFVGCTDAAIYLNKAQGCRVEGNRMSRCGANIQLRFAETTSYVGGNVAEPEGTPVVRCRDGATLLTQPVLEPSKSSTP